MYSLLVAVFRADKYPECLYRFLRDRFRGPSRYYSGYEIQRFWTRYLAYVVILCRTSSPYCTMYSHSTVHNRAPRSCTVRGTTRYLGTVHPGGPALAPMQPRYNSKNCRKQWGAIVSQATRLQSSIFALIVEFLVQSEVSTPRW